MDEVRDGQERDVPPVRTVINHKIVAQQTATCLAGRMRYGFPLPLSQPH
jgi:hypothetical protein